MQLQILSQLIQAMEEAQVKLEIASKKENQEEYDKVKNAILNFQKQINREIKKNIK